MKRNSLEGATSIITYDTG